MSVAKCALPGTSSAKAIDIDHVWVDLVLIEEDPPIPFDDAAVLQVIRDHLGSFLPIVGGRHRGYEVFSHDASRCAGSAILFEAASRPEAEWLAAQNPWRRVGKGTVFPAPRGLFRENPPSPGPSVQRGP